MKHGIIAICALSVLMLWSYLGFLFVQTEVSELITLMDNCENHADQDNWSDAEDYAMEALARWDSLQPRLTVVCRSSEIDDISTSFGKMAECLFSRDLRNFKLINSELMSHFDHLIDRESPGAANIF